MDLTACFCITSYLMQCAMLVMLIMPNPEHEPPIGENLLDPESRILLPELYSGEELGWKPWRWSSSIHLTAIGHGTLPSSTAKTSSSAWLWDLR